MKKILIVRPIVDDSNPAVTNYIYPKNYNAKHASHICYNFAESKNIRGGHLGEGMVIYNADSKEINALLLEDGIEEINFDTASAIGKKWKPAETVNGIENPKFNINKFIKKSEINE